MRMRRADGLILLAALVAIFGLSFAYGGIGTNASVYIAPIETVHGAAIESGGYLINVNTADAALLQELPGTGEVIAGRIVEYRVEYGAFETLEELMNVSGIGESKLRGLEEFAIAG